MEYGGPIEGPALTVTIVAYNSADVIGRAVSSVCADVEDGFAQLVVVDNASPDESADVALRACPQTILIRSKANRYFAGGCNLSWPHVRGRYWLLLNPDVIVPEGGLQELVAWMDAHPRVGAASPRLEGHDGAWGEPGRRYPSVGHSLLELTRLNRVMRRRGGGPTDATLAEWVIGAALIARRAAVERAGLLAEDLVMYAEDSEWCWRIRGAGYEIAVAAGRPWYHEFATSAAKTWDVAERRLRIWAGIYDSCVRRRTRAYAILLWLINVAAFALESLLPHRSAAHRATSRAYVRAHLSLVRGAPPFGRRRAAFGQRD
jgi:N-acetylglucosaminyl-diphospho-decaprenol L-rhamnosyltransferase